MKKSKKIALTFIIAIVLSVLIICVLNFLGYNAKSNNTGISNTETQDNIYNVTGNYYVGSFGINPDRKSGAEFLRFLNDGVVEIVYCGWKSEKKYKTYAVYIQQGRKIEITMTSKSDNIPITDTFILVSSKDGEKLYIGNGTYCKVDDMSKEDETVLKLFE